VYRKPICVIVAQNITWSACSLQF